MNIQDYVKAANSVNCFTLVMLKSTKPGLIISTLDGAVYHILTTDEAVGRLGLLPEYYSEGTQFTFESVSYIIYKLEL